MTKNETEIANYSSWRLIRDLLVLLKPYRGKFLLASLVRVSGDIAWIYPALAFASLVTFLTEYESGASLRPVWTLLGLWLGAVVIRSLSQFFAKSMGNGLAEKLAIDAMLKTVRHLFRLDMAWHERENSGNKIKRIQNAVVGFNGIIRIWFNNIIEIVVKLIGMNIIIAQFDRMVSLFLIGFLVTYFIISSTMTRRAGKASYEVNAHEEEVSGLMFETINNIRTVKAMAMAPTLLPILTKSTNEMFQKIGVRIFWYQSRNAILTFWGSAGKILIIIFIIWGVLNRHYEVGFLILFNSYFTDLRHAMDELAQVSIDFVIYKLSIARMNRMLEEPVTIDDENGKVALMPDWQKISIHNISFAYGKNKALDNISFDVRRGEKVGIVGLSGAGKSTLFKLLLKEREEFTGEILFDSLPIQQIRKTDYFQLVSVVMQDTEVFNFSLKDNITITNAKVGLDKMRLEQALEIAHLMEVVEKLPQGLDTLIGEKGVKLSGGERQRLGIARAVYKQPQVLLLDEATSHLDLESEAKIRDSLHKFFENVTAIVIAHRLSTIREMDKILVIEKGRLVESGSFEELMQSRGRFFELWQKQDL